MKLGWGLDSDDFARVVVEYRSTPDHNIGYSPAQVVFGHLIHFIVSMVKRQ